MGQLARFDLGRIMADYDTPYLFESGTFLGDGVVYASGFPFKKIISVEIIPEIAAAAKQRFAGMKHVSIIHADSISALKETLPTIKKNIVFWLDAHFPGADAGIKHYDDRINEKLRLPLQQEIEMVCAMRKGFNDVFIIDDLRIYEDADYQNGRVPADAMPASNRNIDFIYDCFSRTHCIFKSLLDEGYILLLPQKKYRKAHTGFLNLFRRNKKEKDHYLNPNYIK